MGKKLKDSDVKIFKAISWSWEAYEVLIYETTYKVVED